FGRVGVRVVDGDAGGRAASLPFDRRRVVEEVLRVDVGALAIPEVAARDHVDRPSGAVPGSITMPLHVGVEGEQLPHQIEGPVVLVAEAHGEQLPLIASRTALPEPAAVLGSWARVPG